MTCRKISSGEYLGFLAYFNRVSTNGAIGPNELRAILERAGRNPTSGEVREIISCISINAMGINFQAYLDCVARFQQLRDIDSEYREAFRIYDKTGDGRLSEEDIEDIMKRLCVRVDVPKLFAVADTDKNGFIEYAEFVELMKTEF